MRLAFDIETDGLLDTMTTIHSLVLYDIDTGEGWSACDRRGYVSPLGYPVISIRAGLAMLVEAALVIGHNIIKFDIPAIAKVHPWFAIDRRNVFDTLIWSRLVWPNLMDIDTARKRKKAGQLKKLYEIELTRWQRQITEDNDGELTFPERQNWVAEKMKAWFPGQLTASHGLEAWGYRLGEWKGDYSKEMKAKDLDPWAAWNPEMQAYCEQDVVVTVKLMQKIEEHNYPANAAQIEHDFAWILAEMERNGFPFHRGRALKLQRRLMKRHSALQEELQVAFPPITETWDFVPKANNKPRGYVKGVPFKKTKDVTFNPGSRQHIAKWLKAKYEWVPKTFTETGQPAIDEKVLKKLPFPEAKLLAEYFLIDKRLGMLEGKMGRGLIPAGKSGRIHGNVNTNAAVTRRCTHSSPNMAQLPATNVPFGKDFRDLMYAPEGWSLLGWDALGLELRCFAHYMALFDGGAYTKVVLDGDIHWTHVQALGLVEPGTEYDPHDNHHDHSRNKIAKRFIYAYLYGAGAETIGEIVSPNGSTAQKRREGKKLMDEFLKRTPALIRLKKILKETLRKRNNKLIAIDGGVLHVRSEHSALNTLLQSAGAVAVKVATILFYDKLIEQGLRPGVDFMLVAHVHDEVQTLVRKGLEDVVGKTAEEAMREAGEALGFKCPLAGDYKYGSSWAETH